MTHKAKNNYAFIDSQNLNLGVSRDVVNKNGKLIYKGKKLDYKKFRIYLREKYGVSRAYLFIGLIPTNNLLYSYLQNAGYTVVFKTIATYIDKDGNQITKGNVDTDIVLYSAAILAGKYNKALFVSGDGDFLSLYEYMDQQDTLEAILVPNRHRYSKLLNNYRDKLRFVSDLQPLFLANKKTRSGGRSSTLGLPGHGDATNVAQNKHSVNKHNSGKTKPQNKKEAKK